MAFIRIATALLLLQLSLLLCTSFTVYGEEVDGLPSHPPYKPPYKPQVKPPCKAVAVQGAVYCKSCKYRGVDTIKGGSPLAGAVVKLKCSNTKHGDLVEETKTDNNGYFLFRPLKLTTDEAHKCRVYLVSSPLYKCSVPTNINGGTAGAILISAKNQPKETIKKPIEFFSVGPFAFEPLQKLCYYC